MRTHWSSRFAFIMASTGAAVGLGNIWKFPYMAGENGGGLFVLLYLICVALIGLPAMMAEILLGRLGQANPVTTLEKLAIHTQHSPQWKLFGWWGAFGLILILSFYSVVAGWSVGYLIKVWQGEFVNLSPHAIEETWKHFLSNPSTLILWHSFFMLMTLWVVAKGVRNGIERATTFMMPALFVILIVLTIYCAMVGDLKSAFDFLIKPDFAEVNANTVIYALGHAFFTLAVGCGTMLVYGAYSPSDTRIGSSVVIIALLDVLVAMLSGITIFSLVFKYHLVPEGGPGLMFKVLPIAFSQMPGGQWIGGLFFILLWFAAWAAALSMAEPLVVLLMERAKFSRVKACIWIGILCWSLGLLALFSFNIWSDIKLFGRFTFFEAMADLATNIVLPLGGAFFALFAGWALHPQESKQGLLLKSWKLFKIWRVLVRYVAPIGILIVLFWNLWTPN